MIRVKNAAKLVGAFAASSAVLISSVAQAATVTWDLRTAIYWDPSVTFVTAELITEATPDSLGHYQILGVTGLYGSDPIIGLANRVVRALPGYSDLDNFISVSPSDSPMSCAPDHSLGYAFNAGQPHFTCAGAAFQTTRGVINLTWGGATDMLYGYDMTVGYPGMFRHTFSQRAQSVPEPATLALVLFGAALAVSRTGLARKGALPRA